MSEYVTIGVIIKANYKLQSSVIKCSLKVSKLLQLIVSLGRLFHNEVGKKLYLYASIAVSINLRSLPQVAMPCSICYIQTLQNRNLPVCH